MSSGLDETSTSTLNFDHRMLHSKLFFSWICFSSFMWVHIKITWHPAFFPSWHLSCLLVITEYYWILPCSRRSCKDSSLNPCSNPRRFCYYAHFFFFFITKLVACRVLGFGPGSGVSVCTLASRLTGSFANTCLTSVSVSECRLYDRVLS